MAYLLGFLSWIPLAAVAVLTGRLLAAAHRTQTRPFRPHASANRLDPSHRLAAAGWRPEFFDDWSFAWDDLR